MVAIMIVAIILLAGYLFWIYQRDKAGSRLWAERRPFKERQPEHETAEASKAAGDRPPSYRGKISMRAKQDKKVVLVPDTDVSTEVSEELADEVIEELAEEFVGEIPEAFIDFSKYPEFGQDYVVLIARDPKTLFAYWEVTFFAVEAYARETGETERPQIVLRIHDASAPEPWYTDIYVNARAGNYYLPVPFGRAFYAEIGFLGRAGFWSVARSNLTAIPTPVFGFAGSHEARFAEYAAKARMLIGISS